MQKSNEKLCEEIQNNSSSALELLVQQNTKLIYSLMNRFHYGQEEKEDLFSCAKIGLIKASYNFNPSYNCMFSTYAVPLILGEIKKYFRDNSSLHISRSYKDLYREIMNTIDILESKNQKNVSLQEVAEFLSLSYEDVLFAYEAHYMNSSLDAPINNEDDLCLMDTISDNNHSELTYQLNLALDKLEKRERLIIELRYFQGYTQEEVAQRLFLSQVQISRLEKKILDKLKIII